jgi:hypothetical protein
MGAGRQYYSPAMQPDLYQLLISRLRQQGINNDEAPAILRDLSNIIESTPGIDSAAVISKLRLLGWNGVTLDYQSLQPALAWMEMQVGKDKEPSPTP